MILLVPTISSFTSTTADGRYKVGDVINITATVSKDVLQGSSMTVSLGTGDTVELIANSTGTKLTGTYRPSSGDNTTDLTITAVAATSGKTVTTPFGQNMTAFEVPNGQNLSDNSAIIIDTTAPLTVIESVEYDPTANTITLTGDKFTGAGATGTDIKAQLDWTKFVWDIDGDPLDPGIAFAVGDIDSAEVTSNTELTITLTDAKAAALEAADGFAADVTDGNQKTIIDLPGLVLSRAGGMMSGVAIKGDILGPDIDISEGFIRDLTGNAATTDAAPDMDVAHEDFFTTSADQGSFVMGIEVGVDLIVYGDLTHVNERPTKAITAQDALDALRLAVGLATTSGSKDAFAYIAADFNQDGRVSAQDALEILKYSVGFRDLDAEWKFIDGIGDYSDIGRRNTVCDEGVNFDAMSSNLDVTLTGVLLGDVNDTYSAYLDIM